MMKNHLNRTDKAGIFTVWSIDDIIEIADREGENLNMTPEDIGEALRFALASGDAQEPCILETVKEAHRILRQQ
jgi:hypothetical protein